MKKIFKKFERLNPTILVVGVKFPQEIVENDNIIFFLWGTSPGNLGNLLRENSFKGVIFSEDISIKNIKSFKRLFMTLVEKYKKSFEPIFIKVGLKKTAGDIFPARHYEQGILFIERLEPNPTFF